MWKIFPLGWLSVPLSKLYFWLCITRQEKTLMFLAMVLEGFFHSFSLGIFNTVCFWLGFDRWDWFLPLGCCNQHVIWTCHGFGWALRCMCGTGTSSSSSLAAGAAFWIKTLINLENDLWGSTFFHMLHNRAINSPCFFIKSASQSYLSITIITFFFFRFFYRSLLWRIRTHLWLAPGFTVCQSRLSSACWETIKVRDSWWHVLLLDLSGRVTHSEWQLLTGGSGGQGLLFTISQMSMTLDNAIILELIFSDFCFKKKK